MKTNDNNGKMKSFRQTNGKTSHARSNCGNLKEKGGKSPDCDTKVDATLSLLMAMIRTRKARAAIIRQAEEILDVDQAISEMNATRQLAKEQMEEALRRVKEAYYGYDT